MNHSITLKDLFGTPRYAVMLRRRGYDDLLVIDTPDRNEALKEYQRLVKVAPTNQTNPMVLVGCGIGRYLNNRREITGLELKALLLDVDETLEVERTPFDISFDGCVEEVFDDEQRLELEGELIRLKDLLRQKLQQQAQGDVDE